MKIFFDTDMFDPAFSIAVRLGEDIETQQITGIQIDTVCPDCGITSITLSPSGAKLMAETILSYLNGEDKPAEPTLLLPPPAHPSTVRWQDRPSLEFDDVRPGDIVILKSANKMANEHLEGELYRVNARAAALSENLPALLHVEPLAGGKEITGFVWRFVASYSSDYAALTFPPNQE